MTPTQVPLVIADLIIERAQVLAKIIDPADPRSLAQSSELRRAFLEEVFDRRGELYDLVMYEAEMQLHRPDGFGLAEVDRRPTRDGIAESAADRLIDVVQNLDPELATRERIAGYIALELAGIWHPRMEGMRELTELGGTNFRSLGDVPAVGQHFILLKTPRGGLFSAMLRNGVVDAGPSAVPAGTTWMFAPE
jgi:hypothetical protein